MLTVVSVAFPFAEVSPDTAGGAEQVVSAIDAALVKAGQRSLVLGNARSRVAGELLGVAVPAGAITPALRTTVALEYRARLSSLLASRRVDVIHFHGVDCADYLPDRGAPRIVTLHLAPECYAPELFQRGRGLLFTCVSRAQRRTLDGRFPIERVIENGVDLDALRPLADSFAPAATRRYAACLGRICPEKGFDRALRAAHAAGVRLTIAGQVFPYPDHERYFAETLQPLLDAERTFAGAVHGERKRRFLAEALCLVVPSRALETSSLVTMEALAAGTPVVVTDRGALPSLVDHGVTGFVASDERELAEALHAVHRLDRRACRESAESRFDVRRTTEKYIALYRRLARARAAESAS
jgi:glycosyltransferase involved in cell wall biosynthesis